MLPVFAHGQSVNDGGASGEIRTVVQDGVVVKDFDVSADDRFVITTNYGSVALWDFKKRRLIKEMDLPDISDVRIDALNPAHFFSLTNSEAMRRASAKDIYYDIHDILTGERVGKRNESRLAPKRRYAGGLVLRRALGRVDVVPYSSRREVSSFGSRIFSPTGKLSVSADDSLVLVGGIVPRVWDLRNATLAASIPYAEYAAAHGADSARIMKYSVDCKFDADGSVLVGGYTPDITRWALDGSILGTINVGASPVLSFETDGNAWVASTPSGLVVGSASGLAPLPAKSGYAAVAERLNREGEKNWNLPQWKDIYYVHDVSPMLPDGSFFVAHDANGGLGRYKDGKYSLLREFLVPVTSLALDPARKMLAVGMEMGCLCTMPVDGTGKEFPYDTKDVFRGARVGAVEFLPGGYLAAGCSDNTVGFWKVGAKDCIGSSDIHGAEVVDIAASHDGSRFFTTDRRGRTVVWDAASRKPIVSMLALGDKDFIFLTPDNYYMGSQGIYDHIHFVKGLDVYGFDQFDLKLNRPDIVLARLGAPESVVATYRKAWEKRVKKMGFSPDRLSAELHVPTVELDPLPFVTSEKSVALRVRAKDTKYPLARLMVNVNGVPVESRHGKEIKAGSEYVAEIPVELASGTNVISVSVFNDRGVESYKAEAEIWRENPDARADVYVAAVGVSEYDQPGFNLNYAAKDATDFIELAQKHAAHSGTQVHTLMLSDDVVDKGALEKIRAFFSNARRDDVAVLFYAGHGLLDANMDYFLATHDVDFNNPAAKGWSYDDFEDVIDGIAPLKKFCFVDACHSGEIDKDDFVAETTKKVEAGTITFRAAGAGLKEHVAGTAATRNLVKNLFIDFRQGTGATVLSSSDGMEVSIEGGGIANGLFTHAILQGVTSGSADADADGEVSMSELSEYVGREVSRLSAGTQTPGIRLQNRRLDYKLFRK